MTIKTFKKTILITSSIVLLSLATPASAFAQGANQPRPVGSKLDQLSQSRMPDVKTKADQEIDRRIASLNSLVTKVQSLKRLTDASKSEFTTEIQNEISTLNTLKAKIDADTDPAVLRSDRQSITKEYRVYMLFIPQLRILAAADAMSAAADTMNQIAAKLATRIDPSQQATLDDAKAKIADAQTQYKNAESAVVSLTPDGGDDTKVQANNTALKSARDMIRAGAADLKAARADFQTLRGSLKPVSSPTPTP